MATDEDMNTIRKIKERIIPLFDRLLDDIESIDSDIDGDFALIAVPVVNIAMSFLISFHVMAGGSKESILNICSIIYDDKKKQIDGERN